VRIAVLSTSYPRDRDDWAGHFVRGLARWFREAGHEVTVLCAGPGTGRTQADEDGLEVVRIPGRGLFYGGGAPEALARPMAWAAAARFSAELGLRAARVLRGTDALVTHWLVPCGMLGCLLLRGRPHLAIAHSGDVHLLERLGRRALCASVRLLAGSGARLACASAPLRTRLLAGARPRDRDCLLDRSAIVPMGIDVAALRPRRARPMLPGRLVAAFVGRRSPIKGLEVLERAAQGVAGVTLRVADGGVVGEAKRALLEEVDVLCVPSIELPDGRTEGTPTVVLEGMAAGLPVLASRTGGIPDVLRDGVTGLLLPPGDVARLRDALITLRDDPALRQRLSLASLAEADRYDWSRVGPTLASLL